MRQPVRQDGMSAFRYAHSNKGIQVGWLQPKSSSLFASVRKYWRPPCRHWIFDNNNYRVSRWGLSGVFERHGDSGVVTSMERFGKGSELPDADPGSLIQSRCVYAGIQGSVGFLQRLNSANRLRTLGVCGDFHCLRLGEGGFSKFVGIVSTASHLVPLETDKQPGSNYGSNVYAGPLQYRCFEGAHFALH